MTREEQIRYMENCLGKEGADALIPLFEKAYPERAIADLSRLDYMFRANVIEYVEARTSLGGSVYSYIFNHDLPIGGSMTPWHCADIPYVFHNASLVPYTQESGMVMERLEQRIFDAVMTFARTGNPTHPMIPVWPSSTAGCEHTMMIDNEWDVRTNFDHELQEKGHDIFYKAFIDGATLEKAQH